MDSQTWASALKRVGGTLGRWPALILLPMGLILPRYPEPWGTSLTLIFIGLCIGQSIRYALQINATLKRQAEAARVEAECRLELLALTMEIDAVMHRQMKAICEGQPGAAEAARRELERIFALQARVMQKWKSSDSPDTK